MTALDQMPDGGPEPCRRSRSAAVERPTRPRLAVAAVHIVEVAAPDWAKQTLGLLRTWLEEGNADAARQELLRGMLSAFGTEKDVQELIAQALHSEKTAPDIRLLLLETIAQLPLDRLPAAWNADLRRCLDSGDERIVRQAVACLRGGKDAEFTEPLLKLATDPARPKDLRVAALTAAAPQLKQLEPAAFQFLCGCLAENQPPLLRLAAADAAAQAALARR